MQLIVTEEISYAETCEVQLETIPISLGTLSRQRRQRSILMGVLTKAVLFSNCNMLQQNNFICCITELSKGMQQCV
jgi:hypothetical protein